MAKLYFIKYSQIFFERSKTGDGEEVARYEDISGYFPLFAIKWDAKEAKFKFLQNPLG